MKRITATLVMAAFVAFGVVSGSANGQNPPTNRNGSVKGEMKASGSEVGKAGTSLGSDVKHGQVASGGKHFGKHMYRAGKHFGKGTGKAAKKTGHTVKKAVKP